MSDFKQNRQALQQALFDSGVVVKVEDTHYTIVEDKNKSPDQLQQLHLHHVPNPHWVIDLETDEKPFCIEGKKAEQAILSFIDDCLVVVLVEMKTVLRDNDLKEKELYEKLCQSIRQILVFLSVYQWDELETIQRIKFYGVVAYKKSSKSITPERIAGLRKKQPNAYSGSVFQAFCSNEPYPTCNVTPYPSKKGVPIRGYRQTVHLQFHADDGEDPTTANFDLQPILKHATGDSSYTVHSCP